MFDIGWQELFIVAVLAIIVIGPKDLPRAMRTVGSIVRKARGMASEFQSSLEDMAREADLDEARKELDAVSGMDIRRELEETIDPTGEFADDMDMGAIQSDLDTSVREAMAPTESIAADASQVESPAAPDDAPGEAPVETDEPGAIVDGAEEPEPNKASG
jgi:sec-independent protein translocase protein TatB